MTRETQEIAEAIEDVQSIARRYGIVVRLQEYRARGPHAKVDGAPPSSFHYAVKGKRMVVAEYVQSLLSVEPEYVLHEVAHIILRHPSFGFDVPEEIGLLQFERALRPFVRKPFRDMIDLFQGETLIESTCRDFKDCKGSLFRSRIWRDGWRVLRLTGVVDDRHVPTWRWPVWCDEALRIVGSWLGSVDEEGSHA